MSDTLRHALARARLATVDVAAALEVDPKTVDRWLKGRIPYPRHRWALADLLQLDESDLWPDIIQPRRKISLEDIAGERAAGLRTIWIAIEGHGRTRNTTQTTW